MPCSLPLAILILILVMSSQPTIVHALTDLGDSNLPTIPWDDVPANETELYLLNNLITEVDWCPEGYSIERILLGDNSLTTFPNLLNLSATVNYIGLINNNIAYLDPDLLYPLAKLAILHVDENPLVGLPDPVYFPHSLTRLGIRDTMVDTLPDMCRKGGGTVTIVHDVKEYTCDRTMLWVRVAYDVGHLVFDQEPGCGAGSGGGQMTWGNLTENLMDADDGVAYRAAKYRRLTDPADFYCFPAVIQEVFDIRSGSKVDCSRRCASASSSPVCLMFAVDHGRCVLGYHTQGVVGSSTEFLQYENWYIVI